MAAQSMVVQFKVAGMPQALGQIRQLSQQMRQMQQLAPGAAGIFASPGRGGGGGGGGRRSTFGTRLSGLIGSTRLNMGAASPLVGRMAGLFGPAASGPLMMAAAGAAGPLTLLGGAAKLAAESLQGLSQNLTTSGGNRGDFARLAGLGVNSNSVAQLAAQLRGNLSDPMAQLARAQMGLGPVSNSPFGQTNSAKVLADTLEGLAGVKNPDQQLRLARMLGLEDQLESLRVSPELRGMRGQDAQRRMRFASPQALQNARDFNFLLEDTSELFREIKDTFGANFMGDALIILRGFNENLRAMMPLMEEFGRGIRDTIREYLIKPATFAAAQAHGQDPFTVTAGLDAAWAMQDAINNVTKAQMANTQAVQQNTAAILNPGTYGAGARARGALPSALLATAQAGGPSEFNRVMNGRSMALGAWSL